MEKMYDMNNVEVKENDYLVWDNGHLAIFYEVINGKLKLIADWQIGSLGLVNYEEDMPLSKLEKVTPNMKHYIDLIKTNGAGHMPLTGSLEDPNEDFDDEDDE